MKPMLAIDEYASIRLMLVCAIATTLPKTIDSSARIISIPCQSNQSPPSATPSRRSMNAKAASLGAVPISSVTAVGAPSYTSGTHMWYGTAPSLNAMPETTNTRPNSRIVAVAAAAASAFATTTMSSEPVAP